MDPTEREGFSRAAVNVRGLHASTHCRSPDRGLAVVRGDRLRAARSDIHQRGRARRSHVRRRPGVAVSSTGRWVAYALTDANDEWNVQEPRPTSHVVVQTLRADRPRTPRALTTGASHSSLPVWSPHGRRLAFIREDKIDRLDSTERT